MDNVNKRAKVLRATGRAVDEPALESLKHQHKIWLSEEKRRSKNKEDEQAEDEKVGEREQEGADAEADAEGKP